MAKKMPIKFLDILKAHQRIMTHIHRTSVFTSSTADHMTGRKLFFKAENLQKTGCFKARGALNSVLSLKEQNPKLPGVVTHSSGNHGQGLAWAAKLADVPCAVVVPEVTPKVKKSAIKDYGAELVTCGPEPSDREDVCERVTAERGYIFVSPENHDDAIAGQGTVALEFLVQVPELDAILISVGGGGLAAAIAIATKQIKPEVKIFLVEPKGKMMEECLRAGQRLWPNPSQNLDTIADALIIQQVGLKSFPVICQLAEKEVFSMTDKEMILGMKFAFQKMKLVIEAAAGAAVAAALSQRLRRIDSSLKHVGVILCGGNIDIEKLPWY